MKQLSLIALVILFLTACKKKETTEPGSSVTYYNFYGEIGTNDNSTCLSNDGNLLICGSNASYQLSLLKITKDGNQIWRRDLDAGNSLNQTAITQLNGEIFICSSKHRNNAADRDVLLIKTNSQGDTIWTKTYGGLDDDIGRNIIATSDGKILISGKTESFGDATYGDFYLIKVDTDGQIIWEMSYPDPDQEVPFHLIETQNGEYLVTGSNEDPGGSGRELYLLKVSASGQQVWNKKIGPVWKWGYSTIETASGDLITCGQQYIPFNTTQVMLVKTDNLGNVIWEKEYGESASEQGNSVKQNTDGTFTITGISQDNGQAKIILLKTDENGNQLWFKKLNDYYDAYGANLLKDGNDNIITGNRNGSIFMLRTDGDGVFK